MILRLIPSIMSGSSKSRSSFLVASDRARHSLGKNKSNSTKAHLDAVLDKTSAALISLCFTVGWSRRMYSPRGSPSTKPAMHRVMFKATTTWGFYIKRRKFSICVTFTVIHSDIYYSETANSGPSEKRTTSVQQSNLMPNCSSYRNSTFETSREADSSLLQTADSEYVPKGQ